MKYKLQDDLKDENKTEQVVNVQSKGLIWFANDTSRIDCCHIPFTNWLMLCTTLNNVKPVINLNLFP